VTEMMSIPSNLTGRNPKMCHHSARGFCLSAIMVGLLYILASCGTSTAPSQPSPSAIAAAPTTTVAQTTASPSAACADVAALKSSLEALTQVRPLQDGVTALTTAIANVKTNLDKAEASASPALQPSVQQVKTAFDELQAAVSGLTADNLKEKAPMITTALAQVATATRALSSTLAESC
jgi:hypothetical protein